MTEKGRDPAARIADLLWNSGIKTGELEQLKDAGTPEKIKNILFALVEKYAQNVQEVKADIEAAADIEELRANILLNIARKTADIVQSEFTKAIKENTSSLKSLGGTIAEKAAQGMINIFSEDLKAALKKISEFLQSDEYKAVKERLQAFNAFEEEHREELAEFGEDIQKLAPYLHIELEEAKSNPEFADITLIDLLKQGIDKDGNPTDSIFKQLVERAKQRRAGLEEVEELEEVAKELPRIIANPTDKLNYPLDKPNSIIWSLITDAAKNDPNGQMKLQIDTSKKGSKQDAIVLYSINFDELPADVKITKQLTQFDKRAYIAAAALFNAGNEIVSATQIYNMMGNSGKPKAGDIQKINDSLTKMGAARVYIDNAQEAQEAKGYKHFKYDAALLPFERISAYINGQLTESAIHLFREPPLIAFAKQRNQITTINRQLLESPINKTDANLLIDDYLLERIGHMKSGKSKAPKKILFATIYKQCAITTTKQKQRAPEKIRRYLDHYKKCGWIKGYTEDADGLTIEL